MNKCISCESNNVKKAIDFGEQPPSNRYLNNAQEFCETHELIFGYCNDCGLGQLINPMSPDDVRSHYDWIVYNEPEGHLDNLVEVLMAEAKLEPDSKILGVTYKDDTTLNRFKIKGIKDTYRLKQVDDLGIKNSLGSLESIQNALTQTVSEDLSSKLGHADILLVRHILEHVHKPQAFMKACKSLTKPDGIMVFEVPDCRKVLEGSDHCFIWEEHISYFTPDTLKNFLSRAGFTDVQIKVYPYPMEDSLIAIVSNKWSVPKLNKVDISKEIARINNFTRTFSTRGLKIRSHLKKMHEEGKNIVLFGAGHLATKFINFYQLTPFLNGVVDDNQNKLNRLIPFSKLPIISSQCLDSDNIDLCLLTLNPESEKRVLKAKQNYLASGGKFSSIFSASSNSLDRDINDD